jgi:hypothetical protein
LWDAVDRHVYAGDLPFPGETAQDALKLNTFASADSEMVSPFGAEYTACVSVSKMLSPAS